MTTDQVHEQVTDDEQQWPGVEPSQSFVIPSYQWMLSRIEAADSRIHTLMTFVATVTFAVPTLGKAIRPEIPLTSPWLLTALVIAALIFGWGIYARSHGGIQLPHPSDIFKKWLGKSRWRFQKDAIYWAGRHFEDNRLMVEWKAEAVNRMSGAFVVEMVFLLLWVSRA